MIIETDRTGEAQIGAAGQSVEKVAVINHSFSKPEIFLNAQIKTLHQLIEEGYIAEIEKLSGANIPELYALGLKTNNSNGHIKPSQNETTPNMQIGKWKIEIIGLKPNYNRKEDEPAYLPDKFYSLNLPDFVRFKFISSPKSPENSLENFVAILNTNGQRMSIRGKDSTYNGEMPSIEQFRQSFNKALEAPLTLPFIHSGN